MDNHKLRILGYTIGILINIVTVNLGISIMIVDGIVPFVLAITLTSGIMAIFGAHHIVSEVNKFCGSYINKENKDV